MKQRGSGNGPIDEKKMKYYTMYNNQKVGNRKNNEKYRKQQNRSLKYETFHIKDKIL